ncbi:hypothetical protein DCS_01956 [Drechmeria coniospora]|uniref:Spherulation-specific family 4 n=1 Tax=Drechmeria coniospora TaxID=98403 RepID=A0A151GUQ9_DRECN|nr:hypothetical protein DCS_01956 [Drechmeria coniospora]KYK60818.1 hypothetical protein DCS_01956 [Drechmeria coniospora]ODA83513.1 hypothetical protein RJ55_02027 [Drechmeria coniospora]
MDKPFVLIPLYIYPLHEAWEPLFQVASAHPEVRFIAVVNPNNGPGSEPLPDASYMAVLERLSKVPNICTLGYVHCTYGERDIDAITADIDVYCRWNDALAVEGIFFDEVPSQVRFVPFMAGLADHTRVTWKMHCNKDCMVVYNPGVVVDRGFFEHPDYIVVFEQSHGHWDDSFIDKQLQRVSVETRSKSVAIIHSCEARGSKVESFTKQVCSLGVAGIFVTDELDGGYTKWPATWKRFAGTVAGIT